MHSKVRVLFACIQNSARSQMAEALPGQLGGERLGATSAGSRPAEAVSPLIIEVLAERGIDWRAARPKDLEEFRGREFELFITMGCGEEACPYLRAREVREWHIPDPVKGDLNSFRQVRDLIAVKVRNLVAEFGG